MDNRLLVNRPIRPISPNPTQERKVKDTNRSNQTSFREVMSEKLKEKTGVKFSKHAQDRLLSRGIQVNEQDLQQLKAGVAKAEQKGSRDSLIMVNKIAYVVSVENKTVITAIDDENLKENVFTNIDSAVFM